MCLALKSVSDENIKKILSSPPLIWRLLATDDPEIYLDTVRDGKSSNFFTRLLGNKKEEPKVEVPNLNFIEGENIEDDLDKSWQGIHYCLNKTEYDAEPPLDFITIGGESAGDVEVGYGPARLFESHLVKEIHAKIKDISRERLHDNYDPVEMDNLNIYPKIWVRDGEEGFEYIAEYFEFLKKFVDNCVKHNLGMAIYLC